MKPEEQPEKLVKLQKIMKTVAGKKSCTERKKLKDKD